MPGPDSARGNLLLWKVQGKGRKPRYRGHSFSLPVILQGEAHYPGPSIQTHSCHYSAVTCSEQDGLEAIRLRWARSS